MSTPSQPDASKKAASPFSRELIEKEIEHLKKGRSVRNAQESRRGWSHPIMVLAALGLFWLYSMDAFLFSYNRGDAARVYLYLHNYGDDHKADAVAACGLLTPREVHWLSQREGKFQDYFNGTGPAEKRAAELVHYMDGVHALHEYRYNDLSSLNKVRYILFMRTGLTPPIHWDFLNSAIEKQTS